MDIGRSSFVRATIEELERQVSASGPNATSDEQALILGPLFAVDAGSYHTTGFVMFSTIFADDATRMVILAACLFEYVGARATGGVCPTVCRRGDRRSQRRVSSGHRACL